MSASEDGMGDCISKSRSIPVRDARLGPMISSYNDFVKQYLVNCVDASLLKLHNGLGEEYQSDYESVEEFREVGCHVSRRAWEWVIGYVTQQPVFHFGYYFMSMIYVDKKLSQRTQAPLSSHRSRDKVFKFEYRFCICVMCSVCIYVCSPS